MVAAKGPMPVAHACASSTRRRSACGTRTGRAGAPRHQAGQPDAHPQRGRAIIKVSTSAWPRPVASRGRSTSTGTARSSREPSAARGLTLAGQTLGTPEFIAPEQIGDAQRPTSEPTSTAWAAPCITSEQPAAVRGGKPRRRPPGAPARWTRPPLDLVRPEACRQSWRRSSPR